MDAARKLAGTFTDLLNIARPGSDEVWLISYGNVMFFLEPSLQLKY